MSNWADMQTTPDAPVNPPEEPDYCSGSLCDLCRVPAEKCPGTDPELQVNEDGGEPPPPDIDMPQTLGWRDYLLLVYPK